MFKDDFITACRAHHLALKSQRTYWSFVNQFLIWLGAETVKDLEVEPTAKFRSYLSEMANANGGNSASAQNGAFHAIRFFYEKVMGIKLGDLSGIPRATGHQRIVQVPDGEMARKIVAAIPGQQGTALRLIYGTGARLSDVLKLRVKDLDFTKKLVLIQESKGNKSRLAPMPASLISELKSLVGERGLNEFLFLSNRNHGQRISDVTLQRAFAQAKKQLEIEKRYTIHSLRHAAAQWWERNGVERSRIQALLGHSNSSTTDRYLLSGCKSVSNVPTPI